MNIFLSIFVLECFIMPNRIFFICLLYNEYSYLQPVLHLYACMYMGFVPENKLIRIRIRTEPTGALTYWERLSLYSVGCYQIRG